MDEGENKLKYKEWGKQICFVQSLEKKGEVYLPTSVSVSGKNAAPKMGEKERQEFIVSYDKKMRLKNVENGSNSKNSGRFEYSEDGKILKFSLRAGKRTFNPVG